MSCMEDKVHLLSKCKLYHHIVHHKRSIHIGLPCLLLLKAQTRGCLQAFFCPTTFEGLLGRVNNASHNAAIVSHSCPSVIQRIPVFSELLIVIIFTLDDGKVVRTLTDENFPRKWRLEILWKKYIHSPCINKWLCLPFYSQLVFANVSWVWVWNGNQE